MLQISIPQNPRMSSRIFHVQVKTLNDRSVRREISLPDFISSAVNLQVRRRKVAANSMSIEMDVLKYISGKFTIVIKNEQGMSF